MSRRALAVEEKRDFVNFKNRLNQIVVGGVAGYDANFAEFPAVFAVNFKNIPRDSLNFDALINRLDNLNAVGSACENFGDALKKILLKKAERWRFKTAWRIAAGDFNFAASELTQRLKSSEGAVENPNVAGIFAAVQIGVHGQGDMDAAGVSENFAQDFSLLGVEENETVDKNFGAANGGGVFDKVGGAFKEVAVVVLLIGNGGAEIVVERG